MGGIQLKDAQMPCILHWNQNYFVVLYKIDKKELFHIADPGKGLIKLSLEDFCKHWISTGEQGIRGAVLLLTPTEKFKSFHVDEQPNNSKHVLRKYIFKWGSQLNCVRGVFPLGINLGRREAIFNRVSTTRSLRQRKVT